MNSIIFLQTHIENYQDTLSLDISQPVISIFGITMDCKPVHLHVKGFLPYFYIEAPVPEPENFIEELEETLEKIITRGKLLKIEKTQKQNIYGYSTEKKDFYKLFFNNPSIFHNVRNLLEKGLSIKNKKYIFKTFESNISYVLRFMIDKEISGMSYLHVSDYERINDLEISCYVDSLTGIPNEGEYAKFPSFKILSFDIECVSMSDSFPSSKTDPIIQIGNTLCSFSTEEVISKDIFCLKEVAGIPGANVFCFENEYDLLVAWRNYILQTDPDIIIGYNIKNFDFPYIFERAEVLKIKDFTILGRGSKEVKSKEHFFSNRALGARQNLEVEIQGRMVFDMIQFIRMEYKLRSYSLNFVSVYFLGEQKEDVPYNSMKGLQEGGKDSRRRIATYCLRDTYLPLRLFLKLKVLIGHAELARVTGLPIDYLSTRGQSIKVLSLILRAAKPLGYVIPALDVEDSESTYEGAFVLEPLKGFYKEPIAVLDFSSLYPSIMIAKNLCYTTLLSNQQIKEFKGNQRQEEVTETPTKNFFVKKEVKEGLLPQILISLINERKKARAELARTTDPGLKALYFARQNALKLSANSIYGFTGAVIGKLPCIEISQSVTAFGRDMISFTKTMIEEKYNIKKGFSHNTRVIYGDTDSVMINFKEENLEKVFKMAKEISEFVTSQFVRPISLAFEKVYFPYLLINKKRYAGLVYTSTDKPDKIDTKGIETVRRDNCSLVKNVIETCLNKILFQKDVEGAKEHVRSVVRKLYLNEIDLSQLVISKALTKKGDKYLAKQAHVELAEKMKKRDEGSAPVLGDRVAYVIVKGDKNMAAYEKSEDPVYVLDNNIPIDTEYYLENQLSNPIHRLFEPIMDNVSELLRGEHTRKVHIAIPSKGPMSSFITKKVVCYGCKAPGSILCKECRKNFGKHLIGLQSQVEKKEELFGKCWVECQRCQGSINNEVLCINRDCPIFYMRTKVKKELIEISDKLKQLKNIEW